MKCLFVMLMGLMPLLPAAAAPLGSVDLGTEGDAAVVGFGWSEWGQVHDRPVRWVDRLEADLNFRLSQPADTEIVVTAALAPVHWRRHKVGVWVNNRFVGELPSPRHNRYHVYRFQAPAEWLVHGENTLTLRMAYRIRIGQPTYRFSFAVDRVELWAIPVE